MDIEIIKAVVGQMKTNCYLIIDKKSKKTIIIDPGDDAGYLENLLKDKELKPQAVVLTHGHFDHAMAALQLKLAYNVPFLASKKDEFLLKDLPERAKYYLAHTSDPAPQIDKYLEEGSIMEFGYSSLTCLETPGHTPGSICLYDKINKVIFTGDTLFAKGTVGRTDFSYASKEALEKSLKMILNLPLETKIYPGHGMSSDIRTERKYHIL